MDDLKIHPAAESARLMRDDELAELAADIAENGQADPITIGRLNGSKTLVDGRNRLRACEIAGVEPRFEEIEFESEDAIKRFVRSRNERRNLTKGERAMQLAMLFPEPSKEHSRKRGLVSETKTSLDRADISATRLSQARSVLAYSRELAEAVRDGNIKLDEALVDVKAARDALNSEEAMIARLRDDAPDLADLVSEERMKPREAIAALDERERQNNEARQTARRSGNVLQNEMIGHIANVAIGIQLGEQDLFDRDKIKNLIDALIQMIGEKT
jgi:ParB-like chromosome segregation protein Spo0J